VLEEAMEVEEEVVLHMMSAQPNLMGPT